MKKVLFAGALAACMALSSAAFAAESFGTDGITGTYDKQAGTVSVTTIPASITTGADQLTLVILSGASTDNPTIVKESIMYIDQDSASNANKFKDMGLLNGLEDGTYTLRMGSDAAAAIAEVEFTVTSTTTPGTKEITFVFGDVTGDDVANASDATAIMIKLVGDAAAANAGGLYSIGTDLELASGGNYVFGDVTGDDVANASDATAIMIKLVGDAAAANAGGAFNIGADATFTIVE